MAKKLSPVPEKSPVTSKGDAFGLDWLRWLRDVYYFMGRLLNHYDGDLGGTATLVAGTVTVANTRVTAAMKVRMTPQNQGAAQGHLRVSLNAGVGFTITSTDAADNREVFYELVEVF